MSEGNLTWEVLLGRRDSPTARLSDANAQLPSSDMDLDALISAFAAKGFNSTELVVLSGAHTIGTARCVTFRNRIYNETNIDINFATYLRRSCPNRGGDDNRVSLDKEPDMGFDISYFFELINRRGLLHSDQQLYKGGSTDNFVFQYSQGTATFYSHFSAAMSKMSMLTSTDPDSQIRVNCI